MMASAAFAFYVANFGSYDKTYGTLGRGGRMLMWFWLTNLALLFGQELNAERERGLELEEGRPEPIERFSSSRGPSPRNSRRRKGNARYLKGADMATKMDKDLFNRMRSLGVRKSRAKEVAGAVRKSSKAAPKAARRVMADLSGAVVEIQDRLSHGPEKRSAAAKKAARTRKKKAKARSQSAKKGGPNAGQGLIV